MKICTAIMTSAVALLTSTTVRAQVDPNLPNLVPMFPDRPGLTPDNNFVVTNRLGMPTLEWEILTVNIGGQDWIRPPVDRTADCHLVGVQRYFRMPETHEFRVYWFDPDLGDYTQIDIRRKRTICIWDYGNADHQLDCLRQHAQNFNCDCDSPMYGLGTGNGVSLGWADAYYRGLTGQWASLGSYTGDFKLETELDPDQLLQADDLNDWEKDATHDDNISRVYFTWDGTGVPCTTPTGSATCVTNVNVVYSFDPVCQ